MRKLLFVAAIVSIAGTGLAHAQLGTPAEARAMLEKAVAAVKADKAKALEMFNKGEGGFKDRDLQPFCFNISNGKILATTNPNMVALGTDARTQKDKTGKVFGEMIYNAAKEGTITETGTYMFPRPGQTEPAEKRSFVTRIGDIGCGVGYFK